MSRLARHAAGWIAFGAIFFIGCMNGDRVSAASGQITENQRFTLPDLSGKAVSLDSTLKANKAVLINFWATWCPPCREEIPDLIKLQEKYRGQFTVLGVDVGESGERVSSYAKKAGINYPVLLDSDQAVAESYKIVGIPTSLLVTSDGKIIGEYHAVTPKLLSDVEKALAS